MNKALFEPVTCPFCGKDFDDGHSCQDSEEDEYVHMIADRVGCPCEAREMFNERKKWGFESYKKGEILSKD